MFIQNLKGLITVLLISSFFGAIFFGYKAVFEPKIKGNDLEQLPVDTTDVSSDAVKITPQLEVFKNRAIIRFKTPFESKAQVLFGDSKCKITDCKKVEESEKKEHTLVLKDLMPNTKYYYKLIIDDVAYPSDDFFSFITLEDSSSKKPSSEENSTDSSNTTFSGNSSKSFAPKLDLSEFKKAIKEQDKRFDFNKDGKVNILDYSLYKKSQ